MTKKNIIFNYKIFYNSIIKYSITFDKKKLETKYKI